VSDFVIYMMPYRRGGRTVFYTGHTNDLARRAGEHLREKRDWCGYAVVAGRAPSRRLAMEGERLVKRWPHAVKWWAFTNLMREGTLFLLVWKGKKER